MRSTPRNSLSLCRAFYGRSGSFAGQLADGRDDSSTLDSNAQSRGEIGLHRQATVRVILVVCLLDLGKAALTPQLA